MHTFRCSVRFLPMFFLIVVMGCASSGGTKTGSSGDQSSQPTLTNPKPAPKRLPDATTHFRVPDDGMIWFVESNRLVEIDPETALLEASIGQAFKQVFLFSFKNKVAVIVPGTSAFQSISSIRPVFFTRHLPSEIGIARLTVQPDRDRRYVWATSQVGSTIGYFYPYEQGVGFDYLKVSDDVYKLVLREDLEPGEYGVFSSATSKMFSFRITADARATSVDEPYPDSLPSSSGVVDSSVVKEAQKRLAELGYSPGPADGIMGSRTAAALRSFQNSQGLEATGTINQQTLEGLRNTSPKQFEAIPSIDQSVHEGSSSAQSEQSSSWGKAIASAELKSIADPFADTIEVIKAGGSVEILRAEGEWLFVRYNGHSGYVYSEFINQ